MNTKLRDFICEKLRSTKREGIEHLINYLDENDYFTAPASTRYHGAYEGGLAEHSVNVLDCMLSVDKMLYDVYGMPKDDENSIILVALLHDLCKINCYKVEQKWRKDANNKWESYDAYVRTPDLAMGHGGKSVYLAMKNIELSEREAQAIFWHMGPYDKSEYMTSNEMGEAFTKNSLAYKLNTADMMATYVLENETIEWGN